MSEQFHSIFYKGVELNFYQILDLDQQNLLPSHIEKQYRKKSREFHPDKHKDEDKLEAETLFRALTKAKDILLDPNLKLQYDRYIASKQKKVNKDRVMDKDRSRHRDTLRRREKEVQEAKDLERKRHFQQKAEEASRREEYFSQRKPPTEPTQPEAPKLDKVQFLRNQIDQLQTELTSQDFALKVTFKGEGALDEDLIRTRVQPYGIIDTIVTSTKKKNPSALVSFTHPTTTVQVVQAYISDPTQFHGLSFTYLNKLKSPSPKLLQLIQLQKELMQHLTKPQDQEHTLKKERTQGVGKYSRFTKLEELEQFTFERILHYQKKLKTGNAV